MRQNVKSTLMSFYEINPYIRYADYIRFPNPKNGRRKAYDCKLMYVVSGSAGIQINEKQYKAEKGNLFIWNPGIVYEVLPQSLPEIVILSINFDYTRLHSHIEEPFSPCEELLFDPGRVHEFCTFSDIKAFNEPVYIKENDPENERLLENIVDEYRFKSKGYIIRTRVLFLTLLGRIAEATAPDSDLNKKNEKVEKVIDYISRHYNMPLSNEDISKAVNFHPVYLNRLMVRHTGFSIHKYLVIYRIRKAIYLLNTTKISVAETAYKVGFSDVNTFSLSFRRLMGCSPKAYLRNNFTRGL